MQACGRIFLISFEFILAHRMGEIKIGDAIKQVMEREGWKLRVVEIRIKDEWERIVGPTIARYTSELYYHNYILTIVTQIAPLKQELHYAKNELIAKVNEYFSETVVKELHIK